MAGEFQGKVVVVTGGSRGIGREHRGGVRARGRADRDRVVVGGKSRRRRQDSRAAGGRAADRARRSAQARGLSAVVQPREGEVQSLRHSGELRRARPRPATFVDLPDEAWMDGYALKFFACVRMCRLFWPMLKAAQGHVVNIGGGAARSPGADFTIGGSVNAAMGNFSKGLSQLGKQDGVNVNVIHPGATETERFERIDRAALEGVGQDRSRSCAKRPPPRTAPPPRQAGGHRRADAVPVLGKGAPHPGHRDRGRWRRDGGLLLTSPFGANNDQWLALRLRGRLAGEAFALAADPQILDQAARPCRRVPARGSDAGGVRGFHRESRRARLCRRQRHAAAQGGGAGALGAGRPCAHGRRREHAVARRRAAAFDQHRCGRLHRQSRCQRAGVGCARSTKRSCWAPAARRAPSSTG